MSSVSYNRQILVLLYIACFVSNISQLPFLWGNSLVSLVYTMGWLVLFGILLRRYARCFPYHQGLVFLLLIFDAVIFMGYFLTGRYVGSNFIRPVHLSVFIFMIGVMFAEYIYEENIRTLSGIYIISIGIVVLYVYFETFRGTNWAASDSYLFLAKNSITTIILSAIVLCGVYWWEKHKIMSSCVMMLFSIIIFMMKARAAILILCIITVYVIFFRIDNLTLKIVLMFGIIGIIIGVMKNDYMYDLIIKQIILNNREYNLDTFTTGRSSHYDYFFQHFPQHWVLGTGGTYLECFPLAAWLSYGGVGGTALILLALVPVSILYAYRPYYIGYSKSLKTLLALLCIVVIMNGLFEELAPFGPGIKCYMLWFISGIVFGKMRGGQVIDE